MSEPIEPIIDVMENVTELPDGSSIVTTTTTKWMPPPPPPLPPANRWFGVDCPVADLGETFDWFSPVEYMRDFGSGSGSSTRLALASSARAVQCAAQGCVVHYSCKAWDAVNLDAWLDGLSSLTHAGQAMQVIWSPWHEPNNTTSYLAPTEFKQRFNDGCDIIDAHPNGHLVTDRVPVLTAWGVLQDASTLPAYWPGERATALGLDRYAGPWIDNEPGYPDGQWMLGQLLPHIQGFTDRLMIPELGSERHTSDTSGTGRADFIYDLTEFIQEHPQIVAAGWWQRGGCRIEQGTPEQTALNYFLDTLNNQ